MAVPPWTTADLDGRTEPAPDPGTAPLEDDPVVTVELLRTVFAVSPLEVDSARLPAPTTPAAAAAAGPAVGPPGGVTPPRPGIDRP